MIITVDTNVIYSALYSKSGASNYILQLILQEEIKLALSLQTYLEYYDVLTREKNLKVLNLTVSEVEDTLDLLAALSQKHSIYFLLRPNLIDEKDNIFMECAFASNSDYLITSNVKDFKKGELKGFRFKIVTPNEFYKQWRINHE
ncbi:MAG: putative toxin-antitoxin system toxin component, PIN family [bacterium]